MNKHLVLGSQGEVGSTLVKILKKEYQVFEKDLTKDTNKDYESMDFIHICIPFTKKFHQIVMRNYLLYLKPFKTIVIIHSTVYPGTTLKLSKDIQEIVYSPIRGKHPVLEEGIKSWAKYFCSLDKYSLRLSIDEFLKVGLECRGFLKNPTSLELAKHFSTLMYGYSLLFGQELALINKNLDFNPELVVEFINDTGNHLKDRKIHPFIESIGGHCVRENALMIAEISLLANDLEKHNQQFKEIFKDERIHF